MKKFYLLLVMVCMVFVSFAQLEATWFLPSGIPDDWKTNPYPKSEYVIHRYEGFDSAAQDVMDIWDEIPNGSTCSKYIMDRSERRLPTDSLDLNVKWKAIYDDLNIYVLITVTDDHIEVTTDGGTSEQWELQIATYPDSVPRSVYLPLATDAIYPLDPKQGVGYWTKLGSYYLYSDATGNPGVAIDYSQAYNGVINWSVPFADGISTKFTQLDDNNYTVLWTLPYTALNNFVPAKDTAISLDVKVIDFDRDQPDKICATFNSEKDNVYHTMFYSGIGRFNDGTTNSVSTKQEQNSIQVFPNPAKDKFAIQSESKFNSVSIMDMTGRTVKSIGQVNGQIDVKDIPRGLYIVKMQNSDGKTYSQKIILK